MAASSDWIPRPAPYRIAVRATKTGAANWWPMRRRRCRTRSPGSRRRDLPSEEAFDRIFGVFERFMQRFIDFARGLDEDPGRKT
jgi:hypothetical protein